MDSFIKNFKKRLIFAIIFVLLSSSSASSPSSHNKGLIYPHDQPSSFQNTTFYCEPCNCHCGSSLNCSIYQQDSNNEDNNVVSLIFFLLLFAILCVILVCETMNTKTVLMLQIGLSDDGGNLRRELNEIVRENKTHTTRGDTKTLHETTKALLKHSDSWLYGFSSVDELKSTEEMKRRFADISRTQRKNADDQSFVNVNGVNIAKLQDSFVVVAIVVAAQGLHQVRAIKDSKSIQEALKFLGTVRIGQDERMNVIWSPMEEYQTMSEQKMKEKYTLLKQIDHVFNLIRNPSHIIKIN